MTQNPSYVADATLLPSRIVMMAAGKDHRVVHATAAAKAVGVVHEGTREAPIPGVTPQSALQGESVRVYGEDETCDVLAAAAIAVDDFIASDANGQAVVAAAGQYYIGRAKAAAAIGELARIQVISGQLNT